jgi:hypothetical protein
MPEKTTQAIKLIMNPKVTTLKISSAGRLMEPKRTEMDICSNILKEENKDKYGT